MQQSIDKVCEKHGLVSFFRDNKGYYRCRKCRSESVQKRRLKVKISLVAECGGKCKICGYDKCVGALEFHHTNPDKKSFGISIGK